MKLVNSLATIGLDKFRSIVSPTTYPSGGWADKEIRGRTLTRGILIDRELIGNGGDTSKGYSFQFNPQTISDAKETLYETRNYAGLAYSDYIWGGGSERNISFQLFLDDTPQSSPLANKIVQQGEKTPGKIIAVVLDIKMQDITTFSGLVNRTNTPDIAPFKFSGNAYSNTRIKERGILPDVELIQSFLYPAPLLNEATPKFSEGGIVSFRQFRPPAIVVLSLGPHIYLEGRIKSAPINYTLFDKDLTPLRATIDLVFAVHEFYETRKRF